MALSSPPLSSILTATRSSSAHVLFYSDSSLTISLSPLKPTNKNTHKLTHTSASEKWRTGVSFFPAFLRKGKDANIIKEELLEAIAPLDRGATATSEDQQTIDQIARKLEVVNPTREPLKSDLLNGKWELIYTTSSSILQTQRPKFLRSRTNYQAINVDTLRAQNMESWPFFNQVLEELLEFLVNKPKFEVQNFCKLIHCLFQPFEVSLLCSQASLHSFHHLFQVTADLKPLNARKVAVKFDFFKILGLVPVKAPERATGELEITYLDEELRVSRGDKGNLFVLKMIDPSYRVPV